QGRNAARVGRKPAHSYSPSGVLATLPPAASAHTAVPTPSLCSAITVPGRLPSHGHPDARCARGVVPRPDGNDMPKIPSRDKSGNSRSRRREEDIARRYEGGHGAPYSPTTPETAHPRSPAIDEMKSRDMQDGKADARRTRRQRRSHRTLQ